MLRMVASTKDCQEVEYSTDRSDQKQGSLSKPSKSACTSTTLQALFEKILIPAPASSKLQLNQMHLISFAGINNEVGFGFFLLEHQRTKPGLLYLG